MNRISQFFSRIFKGKADPKPLPPKDEHLSVPAPEPTKPHLPDPHKKELFSWPHRVGFGTFRRLKWINGHPVRPLNRQQKRDLGKLFGEKIK